MISSRRDEKTSIFKVTNEKAERYDDIIYVTQELKKENPQKRKNNSDTRRHIPSSHRNAKRKAASHPTNLNE